jgi:hypothetical protein
MIITVNITGRTIRCMKSSSCHRRDNNLWKIKKRPVHRPLFAKRRRRKGNLSGKAMHDAVPANAETHGLKKSQFLEEG